MKPEVKVGYLATDPKQITNGTWYHKCNEAGAHFVGSRERKPLATYWEGVLFNLVAINLLSQIQIYYGFIVS